MKNCFPAAAAFCLAIVPAFGGEPPANSDVAMDDAFDRQELGKGWNASKGDWRIENGVLRGSEIAEEKHAAAIRRTLATNNAVYSLRVTTWGNYVTARIDGKQPLKASHPTFGVKKPTLVFRCLGDGVEIDDIQVWTQRTGSE
jgi:hypothetical protein